MFSYKHDKPNSITAIYSLTSVQKSFLTIWSYSRHEAKTSQFLFKVNDRSVTATLLMHSQKGAPHILVSVPWSFTHVVKTKCFHINLPAYQYSKLKSDHVTSEQGGIFRV